MLKIPQISTVDEKKEAGDNENTSESRMLENMVGFFNYMIIVNCYKV